MHVYAAAAKKSRRKGEEGHIMGNISVQRRRPTWRGTLQNQTQTSCRGAMYVERLQPAHASCRERYRRACLWDELQVWAGLHHCVWIVCETTIAVVYVSSD